MPIPRNLSQTADFYGKSSASFLIYLRDAVVFETCEG